MRCLFIGPGYPGVNGAGRGSGIGTYLRELCQGLAEKRHECHVLAWADNRPQSGEVSPELSNCQINDSSSPQEVGGVMVHLLPHSYWPVMERFAPDSRDVFNMRKTVRRLDREYGFDWIEIESEEGIGLAIQKDFPDKTILRIHTSLAQMVEYKEVPETWAVKWRVAREKKSFRVAKRIWVTSEFHRRKMEELFGIKAKVIPIGIAPPEECNHPRSRARLQRLCRRHCGQAGAPEFTEEREETISRRARGGRREKREAQDVLLLRSSKSSACSLLERESQRSHETSSCTTFQAARNASEDCAAYSDSSPCPRVLQAGEAGWLGIPRFLVIGSPDRRKGFDRIRPIMDAYVRKHGPCTCVIVSQMNDVQKQEYGFSDSPQVTFECPQEPDDDQLNNLYHSATALLHPARYESFGLPLIEAAARGVPVVATRTGVAEELLVGDLSHFVVDGDDAVTCADVLAMAVAERESVSAAMRLAYARRFTRESMVACYIKALAEVQ